MQKAKEYCEEALKWLIEDGICRTITVEVRQNKNQPDGIKVVVKIIKNDASEQIETFDRLWSEIG